MARREPKKAKNNPVNKVAPLASEKITTTGVTRAPVDDGEIVMPDAVAKLNEQPFDQEKADMLAFMNEDVTIRIATTKDKNAEQVFELNINGRAEFFRRGETKTVKRYFVDRLMRLKETVFGQEMVINNEGIKSYVYPASTGLKYDFAITRDDNPLGASWERAVLAEHG